MKRKVTWADNIATYREYTPSVVKIKFGEIKSAVRKNDVAEVTRILKSLSPEEANDVIHYEDGKIIINIIKSAHQNMKHHKYNKEEFKELYNVLLDLDERYIKNKILETHCQIIKREHINFGSELFVVYKHIDEIRAERVTLKASTCKSVAASTDVGAAESKTDHDVTAASEKEVTDSVTGTAASVKAETKQEDQKESTDGASELTSFEVSNIEYISIRAKNNNDKSGVDNANNGKGSNNNIDSNYILSRFMSWLSDLPNSIRESIEQTDIFQLLLDHYKEMQSELMVRDVKVVIKSSDDITDHTEQQNYNDSCVVNQEEAADVKLENDNLYLDKANALNQSSIEALPIFMLSASTVFDQFEGDCHVPILGEGSYV